MADATTKEEGYQKTRMATNLNAQQQRAVDHRGSRLAVLAGAGTGKTQVITHRIASLVAEGVDPARILAITFTNKAASEMRERLSGMGVQGTYGMNSSMWIGTFHGTGRKILRRAARSDGQRYCELFGYTKDFLVYDMADQIGLIKALLADAKFDPKKLKKIAKNVLKCISKLKRMGKRSLDVLRAAELPVSLDELPPVKVAFDTHNIFERYEYSLLRANAMDFDDLLIKAVEAIDSDEGGPLLVRFDHVLVDEYQDTDDIQRRMVNLLGAKNLCVVGDDDQAIYGWRGADSKGMRTFVEQPDVELIKLERNYRSTLPILNCANAVILPNPDRLPKKLWTDVDGPLVQVSVVENEKSEAAHVVRAIQRPYADHAILYRTNTQSRVFESALRREGIPYIIIGGLRFYDREVIKDVLAYFTVAANPHSDAHLLRIINKPTRGLGDGTVKKIKDCAVKEGISMFSALPRYVGNPKQKQKQKVQAFYEIILGLQEARRLPRPDLLAAVFDSTDYMSALEMNLEKDKPETVEKAHEDIRNLGEFFNELETREEDHPDESLEDYLGDVALVAKVENKVGSGGVTLITIHSSKGLEFTNVHLVGFEEGLIPLTNSDVAEERRLAYVAMTRAITHLEITVAYSRSKWGDSRKDVEPSSFLDTLPLSAYSTRSK